jgi:hypothetical protein
MEYLGSTNDSLNISVGDYVLYNTLAGVFVCRVVSMEIECDTVPQYDIEYCNDPNRREEESVARCYLTKLHHPSYSEDTSKDIILYDLYNGKVVWIDQSFYDPTIRYINGTIRNFTRWEFEHRYLEIPTLYLAARVAGMTESAFRAIMNKFKNRFSLAIKAVNINDYYIDDRDYTSCYLKSNNAANDCIDAMSYLNRYNLVYNSISDVTVGDYVIVHGTNTEFDGRIGTVRHICNYFSTIYVEINGKYYERFDIKNVTKIEPVSKVHKNICPGGYLYIVDRTDDADDSGLYRIENYDPARMIYSIYSLETHASYEITREFITSSKYMYYIPATDYLMYISPYKADGGIVDKLVSVKEQYQEHMNEFIKNYIKNDERSIKDMYNKMFVKNVALCGRGNAKSLSYLQSCLLNSPMFGNLKIKDVKFSGPCTIVFWTDGTKTMVRCQDGETNDPEKGLAMAIAKKFLGTNPSGSNFYDVFKKFLPKKDDPALNKEEKKTEKKSKPVIKARPQKPTNPKLGFIDEFVVAVERRPTYFPADFIKFCKDHHLYFYIEVDGQYVKCDPESTNWQTVAGYCKRGVLAGIKKHKTSGGSAGRDYWAVDINYVIFSRMTPPTTHSEPCEENEDA